MCVIISSPDRKHRPTLATLRLCAAHNPHGTGMAWVEKGKVSWLKGLSAEAIHENLGMLKGPVVIHFRYATVGGKRAELCHPFPITAEASPKQYGQAKEVLFHNGHWSDWERFVSENDIDLAGPVSDSRVIAIGTYLGGAEWLRTIPGRFVIFNKGGAKLFGDWQEVGGLHFSNLNWQPRLRTAPTAQKTFECPRPVGRRSSLVDEAMACFGD